MYLYDKVSILPLSTIFLLDFRTVLTVWYFSIRFHNCSDGVVFFYWISELFRQCGIFLLDFITVPTVWYFSIRFHNCSDSVVFFYWISELFRQCGIFGISFYYHTSFMLYNKEIYVNHVVFL